MCSSCPVDQAHIMAKHYANFWIKNYQNISLIVILQDQMMQLTFY